VALPKDAQAGLEELRENAEAASEALEKATEEHVQRQEDLEEAQEELVGTLHQLQQTEVELGEMREPLARLASTLYRQPDGGMLPGGRPADAVVCGQTLRGQPGPHPGRHRHAPGTGVTGR